MSQSQQHPAPAGVRRHTKASLIVAGFFVFACLAYGLHWVFSAQYRETTEDAYVEGNIVQVTPQTAGTVTAINADNTDTVPAGKVLLTLNPVDARLVLQRAEALLAKTVRQVRGQYSSAAQMQANINLRRVDLARAQADFERRAALISIGAVSTEDFHHSEEAVSMARAALVAAEQQFAGNQALVDRISIEDHPDVLIAALRVRDTYIAATRTELRAPVGGMVTKRNVQVGQRVSPGAPLLAIVPLDNLWVSANFKESQLRHIRIGQPVKLTADVYGDAVEYDGKVVGQDAGTGSAFSLVPAQNATGNWIKVVQRVPVRIALDRQQLASHPLRVGLSMKVAVDTHDRHGQALTLVQTADPQAYATRVFDGEQTGADEFVRKILLTNLAAKLTETGKPKP